MTGRRHNTIRHREDPDLLAGLLREDTGTATTITYVNGSEPRCDECGYLVGNCGCPGSPRLNGRRVTDVPLPVGCPRCQPDGCPGCRYRPHNCTCKGGPRE
jgi:hypothetical protein